MIYMIRNFSWRKAFGPFFPFVSTFFLLSFGVLSFDLSSFGLVPFRSFVIGFPMTKPNEEIAIFQARKLRRTPFSQRRKRRLKNGQLLRKSSPGKIKLDG